jgi:hypothetical protein
MTLELNASDDRGIDIVKQVSPLFSFQPQIRCFPSSLSFPKEIKDFAGTRTIFGSPYSVRMLYSLLFLPTNDSTICKNMAT